MVLHARPVLVVLLSAPLAIAAACGSSDESSSSSSASSGGTDAGHDTGHDPNKNCVKPGTPNNAQGIGGYCQSSEDCVPGKSLCTGLFGSPPDAWFCTRLCKDDPNCGDGLTCVNDQRGIACIPNACLALDGGTDASSDATTD